MIHNNQSFVFTNGVKAKSLVLGVRGEAIDKLLCERNGDESILELAGKDNLPSAPGIFIWKGVIVDGKTAKDQPQLSGTCESCMPYDLITFKLM